MEPRVTVTGNAGVSVTHRVTPSGTHIAELSVANTRRVFKDGQWGDGATTWLNVRCFGHLAENVTASVCKGDPVVVTGRIEIDSWNPPEGGTRTKTWLVADAIGHDLSRGVATFRRPPRAFGEAPDVSSEPPADPEGGNSAHEEERKAS